MTFINFQNYALLDPSGQTFIVYYCILSVTFVFFIVMLLGLANRLFEVTKNQEIKEGSKIILKVISIQMTLYLFLLQIPFMTILLQGYKCEENPADEYSITGIKCDSVLHQVLMVVSTALIILYLTFLITQQFLFSSNDFESQLPWASFEKQLSIVRCCYKLIITASFTFDKAGVYRSELGFVCFAISLFTI